MSLFCCIKVINAIYKILDFVNVLINVAVLMILDDDHDDDGDNLVHSYIF